MTYIAIHEKTVEFREKVTDGEYQEPSATASWTPPSATAPRPRSAEPSVVTTKIRRRDWPNPQLGLCIDTWRALVDARADGEVRSIGVSNFNAGHLERIIDATGEVPAINQIELHPHFPQEQARATPAQVVLRWHQQLGRLQLEEDELRAITSLGRSGRRLWCGDPETQER